jgi:hypothetical protein
MDERDDLNDLIDHLGRTTRLEPSEARRVVEEVVAFLSESPPEFVARRHAELRRDGLPNASIFRRLLQEMTTRRFAAPALTERQIRRLIYG